MKIKKIAKAAVILVFLSGHMACNKSNTDIEKKVEILPPTEITESSFRANWNINTSNIYSIFVEIALDNGFEALVNNVEVSSTSLNSYVIEGLTGATQYYFRLLVKFTDGSIAKSDFETVKMGYTLESVTYTTSDGITIAATISYLSTIETAKPSVIFMHEMGVFVNTWKNSDVVLELVAQGYVCMIMDFRGHGGSTRLDDISVLISDKSLIAKDLVASLDFLKTHAEVDPNKLALVGASLGAITAIAGNGFDEVKASVSVSGLRDGIFEIFPDMNIKSALYIVGELDIHDGTNRDFPKEAEYMFNITKEPKKLIVVPGTSAHGTALLTAKNLNDEIVALVNTHVNKK